MTSPTSPTPQAAMQHIISILQPNAVEITNFFTDYVVFDINAFLTLDEVDFKTSYSPASSSTQRSLSPAIIKKLVNLQRCYASLVSPDVSSWFSLTADDFQAWCITTNLQRLSVVTPVVPTAPIPPASTTPPSFRSSIKVNISDYVKLQNDSQWRVFNRQLRATAAIHDTLDILDPSFVPPIGSEAIFEQKSKFMYNVFFQCILSSKGKVCVRNHERSLDGQLVYSDVLDVYTDQLSAQIDATTLRSELTIMKLDDK